MTPDISEEDDTGVDHANSIDSWEGKPWSVLLHRFDELAAARREIMLSLLMCAGDCCACVSFLAGMMGLRALAYYCIGACVPTSICCGSDFL